MTEVEGATMLSSSGTHQVDISANSTSCVEFTLRIDLSHTTKDKEDYVPHHARLWSSLNSDKEEAIAGTAWNLEIDFRTAMCRTTASSSKGDGRLIVRGNLEIS